jgi:hypothetical protein
MAPYGRPYKHTDLPPRDDPSYMALYREKHREISKVKAKAKLAKAKAENPNYWKDRYDPEKQKKHRALHLESIMENGWKRIGIIDMTYARYVSELQKQGNRCKICCKEVKKFHVDHDHETGLYRGLLCTACNMGLGIYEKNLECFGKYLTEHKG